MYTFMALLGVSGRLLHYMAFEIVAWFDEITNMSITLHALLFEQHQSYSCDASSCS